MIPQVTHLIDNLLNAAIFRGNNCLHSLFPNLLQDFILSLFKKIISVGAFLRIKLPILYHIIKLIHYLCQSILLRLLGLNYCQCLIICNNPASAEAGIGTGMTGTASPLMYDYQQGITITIIVKVLYILHIPRGCSLIPQLLTAAAPEPCSTGFYSFPKGLLIHIGHHKYLSILILDNSWHQALFIKTHHTDINHQNLTSTPRDFK